ncbi:MAG TPA: serine hydrolase domain-containing protein [Candidatus Latescibacteria bacterium]|nr:serine hydrolase domain-containing protein [Candidatus Latescibacterota bacterium]
MRRNMSPVVLALLVIGALSAASCRSLPAAKPEDVGMSSKHLAYLDEIIAAAIVRKDFPGAVLVVAHKGKVVFRKAFGDSQRIPEGCPMTADMIFDLASITKPVATATSIMILVEQGKIRLWDKVTEYVPEFSTWYGEKGIAGEEARLWHLLTHTSGLPPYTDAKEAGEKLGDPCATADLVRLIAEIPKECPVGTKSVYSCLNYITLAHIVRQVTGMTIAEFAEEMIFKPLGMKRTFYLPPESLREFCVPTEVVNGVPLRGVVHDPLARLQGGVSGNAGLFSTADDLAVFAQMLLNKGEWKGGRILSPLTVERMTEIYPRVGASGRGLGWDLDSDYATVRGDLFGPTSYGHSGYTGTSVWIDPETQTSVVFLTNRVHPDDKGDIIALRSKVANVVAAAIRAK